MFIAALERVVPPRGFTRSDSAGMPRNRIGTEDGVLCCVSVLLSLKPETHTAQVHSCV